ncbi:MAG: stage II sporulation protein M [Candidatus Methanofastidiosia archaeon]
MKKDIKRFEVLVVLGILSSMIFLHFVATIYSVISGDLFDFEKLLSLTLKKEILQSFLAFLLLFYLLRKIELEDVKKQLKKNWYFIFASTIFLMIGFLIGFNLQNLIGKLMEGFLEEISEKAKEIEMLPFYFDFVIYFGNNSRVAVLTATFLSWLPILGAIYSLFIITINGMVVGIAPTFFNIPTSHLLVGILPHGIFEIPAFILSTSVGLRINVQITKAAYRLFFPPKIEVDGEMMEDTEAYKRELVLGFKALRIFPLILLLLLIAAINEAVLTPFILRWIFG